MSSQNYVVSARLMVDACLSAIDRLLDATQDPDKGPDETFVPLFEALNWAASIDLRFEEQGNPIGDEPLRGMRFARNRAHHDWALALRREDWPGAPIVPRGLGRDGAMMPQIIGPPPGFYWTWRPLAELPPPTRPDPNGEIAYRNRLAGAQSEATLQALKPVLMALR